MSSHDLATLIARVEELESQLAFAESAHQQLDDTVARQDREIVELRRAVESLAKRLSELRESGVGGDGDPGAEVPPHY